MQKNRKIIIIASSVLLLISYLIYLVFFSTRFKGIEYRCPTWMDNEHIICVKYVSIYKSSLIGFIGDLTGARNVPVKQEIQIVSMDIEGKNEKVIKSIVITYPGQSPTWKEKIFKGILRITSISYSQNKKLIAFGSDGYINGLFLIEDNGRHAKKITEPAANPRFSPDGKYLQYTSNYKVWFYDLDTQQHKVLIENAIGGLWSPDGKKIAFSRKSKEKPWQYDVYVYDVETKKEELFDSKISFVQDWAPKGKIITGSRLLRDPYVSPNRQKIVGEPYTDSSKKEINFIGVSDIDGENLKILRSLKYE